MFKKLVIESFVLLAVLGLLTATTEANAQQLSQIRPRVLISTDIGGTDPDDYWHNCAGSTSFARKSWSTGPVAGRGSSNCYLFLSIKLFLLRPTNDFIFVHLGLL